MFWTLVPTMVLVSYGCAALLIVLATVDEDGRLRKALAPSLMRAGFESGLTSPKFGWMHDAAYPAACVDSLSVLSDSVLGKVMGDLTADGNFNGSLHAVRSGRLIVSLRRADGATCTFPSPEVRLHDGLKEQIRAAAQPTRSAPTGQIAELPDGWTSVTKFAVAGASDAVLTVGVHIMSPKTKLQRPAWTYSGLMKLIFSINTVAALVLLVMLVRRIRRADHAAERWTSGDLDIRIAERGKDELARLTHKFDLMADAMSGVIQMKQELAVAEERNRLARDLHDSAKQRAFALNLQLSALRQLMPPDTKGATLITSALSLTGQLQQDLGSVIRRLSAPTLAESGFRRMLCESIEAMLASSNIALSLSLNDDADAALTNRPEVAQQLFLITIEAVGNVLKHAGCKTCAISGEQSGDCFIWRITDDGVGLSLSEGRTNGMGLANMKLRALGLEEGGLDIQPINSDGGGTIVTVTFRLNRSD
ncbi:two-component system NarL family sensor kinase [Massilia sp. MP_M2]|uniref:HAMP domain-containing sensor histidine kinase n=1 Tax=Massilia sp. MP_M2 TaxID=3071713 RepID=UPI00319E328A